MFNFVKDRIDDLYHKLAGHTLVYVYAERVDADNELGFDVDEFDGWAAKVYKDALGKLCIDEPNGKAHAFQWSTIRFFMIGD